MIVLFLIVIYLAFISLGLPDALLGTAWPLMHPEFGVNLASAGMISMTIAGSTIVSSLLSGWMIRRFGTGRITLASCILTAAALLGFSAAPSMAWLIVLAVPLGLGAGTVDASLNHFVAAHFEAHHMNWLHCFWGVGAMAGPVIMARFISDQGAWRHGYQAVSAIQWGLALILALSLPLWHRVAQLRASRGVSAADNGEDIQASPEATHSVWKIPGVRPTLTAFLLYCGVEATTGLWGASYLTGHHHVTAVTAAEWVSAYYGGITAGRFITGFLAMKISNKVLIRSGILAAATGAVMLILPLSGMLIPVGLILTGLGLSPVFPALIHETPVRFGKTHSAKLIGFQMASAYAGTTCIPPLAGLVATRIGVGVLPVLMLGILGLLFVCSETVNHRIGLNMKNK